MEEDKKAWCSGITMPGFVVFEQEIPASQNLLPSGYW
jgi:hypothetical protein